jgi:hypothetical protein
VSNLFSMRPMRIVVGVLLAAATLTVLISRGLRDPDLPTAVANAIAADDRLLEVALAQYPKQGPTIAITYGQLPSPWQVRSGPQTGASTGPSLRHEWSV